MTLFLVMDGLGNVPVFNAVLSRLEPRHRRRVIARELLIALGILLFIISLRMIFPASSEAGEDAAVEEPFIAPLAVPLTAGPSTVAVLLLLGSNQPEQIGDWAVALLLAWTGTTIILVGSPYLMGMILVILATQRVLNGIREFARSL